MSPSGYHAHVYFDARDLPRALDIREGVGQHFDVHVGAVHRNPVGPHTKGMFQVVITTEQLGEILLWLMRHRRGLSVLIHADTGDDYRDHTEHLTWLGKPVALDVSRFKARERMVQ